MKKKLFFSLLLCCACLITGCSTSPTQTIIPTAKASVIQTAFKTPTLKTTLLPQQQSSSWTKYEVELPEHPIGLLNSITEAPDHSIWASSPDAFIHVIDRETEFYDIDKVSQDIEIHDIAIDANNVIWLALRKDGLLKIENDQWAQYKIEDVSILAVVTTPNGELWAGTSAGLYIFNEPNWQKLNLPEDCLFSRFNRFLFATDENNYLCVSGVSVRGVVEGRSFVYAYNDYAPDMPKAAEGLNTRIRSLSYRDGAIWFIGVEGRIVHIDLITDEMIVFDDEKLLDTSNIFSNFSISGTSEGIVWLFGERGLEIYNNGAWTNIGGSPIQGIIYDIYQAQNGDVWFAGNGIYKYSSVSKPTMHDQ